MTAGEGLDEPSIRGIDECPRWISPMLLRKEGPGIVAIPQLSHAWISGQMARAWGNDRFAPPAPREIVCFAAELHDIGWLERDQSPVFNEETGLPQEFLQVPAAVHTALWRNGVNHARTFGRFVALLVSLHAETIYGRHFDFEKADVEAAALVRRFLDDQRAFQADMLSALAADPAYATMATRDSVDINRRIIATLDWMSLALCWGVTKPVQVPKVPVNMGETAEITLSPGKKIGEILVDPWPFAMAKVDVRTEGRRLAGPSEDEDALREAFQSAPSVVVTAVLRPA
jgi:Protein of unknown function (DUF3891)